MLKEKKSNRLILNTFIEVSFEKLQQHLNGHLISINIKNLRTKPLMEINYIKAKLTYLTVELVDPEQVLASSVGANPLNKAVLSNSLKKKKVLAKINKIKVKKCKFDNNLKNFAKPIDFDLVNEHFMSVTEEAMNLQMKKLLKSSHNGSVDYSEFEKGAQEGDSNAAKKTYLFYLTVEIHSYLPVSRKILSSTFRKKKRIFKGQCQIQENFISSTQFTKNFTLNEV